MATLRVVPLVCLAAVGALPLSAGVKDQRRPAVSTQLPAEERAGVAALADRLATLSPEVDRDEAKRLAQCAYVTVYRLKLQYRMIWPPLLNNVLVNLGIKKRGLCFQWAQDLLVHLDKLKLKTLQLHWGEAQAGTWHESNCIVVTARDQPFAAGIILDAWRRCGNLYWGSAATDEEPWVENSAYERFIRAGLETAERERAGSGRRLRVQGNRNLAAHATPSRVLASTAGNQAGGGASVFSPR
jgi:hypothetical protein